VAQHGVDTATVAVNPRLVPGAATVATAETKPPFEYVLYTASVDLFHEVYLLFVKTFFNENDG